VRGGNAAATALACGAGVRSPWFQIGPLCRDHEHPITLFHGHVLDALGDAVPR
jgi:hypothetical protein